MSRTLSIVALLAAVGAAGTATAADWPEEFREGYPEDWTLEEESPITIELGTRYWYSMGAHRMDVIGSSYVSNDVSHIVEGHLRIDDHTSDFYAKALLGYSAVINNRYSTPLSGGVVDTQSGHIFYGGADLGYTPLGTDDFKFGGFVGYQYWDDSPDMGRTNYVNAGGGASEVNLLYYNMLRLGLSAKAEFTNYFDLSAEIAAIPYAHLGGTYGAFAVANGNINGVPHQQGSAATVSGWLYGAAGEVMAGFHPTEDWSIRVGGRAWYLEGQAKVDFAMTEVGAPGNEVLFTTLTDRYSTLRWGGLVEVTHKF